MLVTLLPSTNSVNEQLKNALVSILTTPLPIVALLSLPHSENAELPRLVTLSGITTLVRLGHDANAERSIRVTGTPPNSFVIVNGPE
jgi:hypothetical protein